jgi:parallel beta-helix repeat protein
VNTHSSIEWVPVGSRAAGRVSVYVIAAIAAVAGWTLTATSAAALPICDPVSGIITACCSINSKAFYQLANSLMTAPTGGDCIDVNANTGAGQGVVLQLNGFNISSGLPGSGIGINIASTAVGTVVDGCADNGPCAAASPLVSGFAFGVVNQAARSVFNDLSVAFNAHAGVRSDTATKALFNDMVVTANGTNGFAIVNSTAARVYFSVGSGNLKNGIKLESSRESFIVDSTANFNGKNGLVLFASNSNMLDDTTCSGNMKGGLAIKSSSFNGTDNLTCNGNGGAGVNIGCSPASVPVSANCVSLLGLPDGVQNSIVDSTADFNSIGIGIDLGGTENIVANNSAHFTNVILDIQDANINCDSNVYWDNFFGTVSPGSCVNPSF